MSPKEEIESEDDDLECPGCYKTRSYAWSDGKCNSCGYDDEEETERAQNKY
jgi:hypothetical protein